MAFSLAGGAAEASDPDSNTSYSEFGIDPAGGFALLTSRCSFELVQKAVLARIPMLVTISAPTELAVSLARSANLTLVALARGDSVLLFNNPFNIPFK